MDSTADVGPDPRRRGASTRPRAGEAFDVFLNERGAKPLGPDVAARLVAAGNQALLAGDLLVVVATDLGYRATSCPDGAATVDAQVRTLLAGRRSSRR